VRWNTIRLPLFLAMILTLVNAAKPVVVDDTAYLLFARHLAQHANEPYSFELFWYAEPQPAMQILLPPVLPYWLALGIRIFGEQLFWLKIWLFPFAALLCLSVDRLMKRFTAEAANTGTIVFLLGPAVLPLFNFMLDIPAIALGTTAVALFMHACDRSQVVWAALAGLFVGLAIQTKYSLLVVPAVIFWFACTHRKSALLYATVALALALLVFAGWEYWLSSRFGESHFLHHLRGQSDPRGTLHTLIAKLMLVKPLLAHFGLLAVGVSIWAAQAAGFRPRSMLGGICAVSGIIAIQAVVPLSILGNANQEHAYCLLGIGIIVTLSLAAWRQRGDPAQHELRFLLGWLLIEVVAGVVLTPFAAARRMIGVTLASAVFAGFAVSRSGSPRWTAYFAVGLGLFVTVLDLWDAFPEQVLAERAARVADPASGGTVWFQGHWGFQYYCGRQQMVPVVPGQSQLKTGDRLLLPLPPADMTENDFFRPHHGFAVIHLDPDRTELMELLEWNDPIPLTTLPSLYGGGVPLRRREAPRLRVAVYRITRDWSP
jgi:hypothetical protein